jgi:hypothetical protein
VHLCDDIYPCALRLHALSLSYTGPEYYNFPVAQSKLFGDVTIPFIPKPGTQSDPDVVKEQEKVKTGQGAVNILSGQMIDKLRELNKNLVPNEKPPMQSQKPDTLITFAPLWPGDDENCVSLWDGKTQWKRGKWIDEYLGNSPKAINKYAVRTKDINSEDVVSFFNQKPDVIPLGTYHMAVDTFDTKKRQIVSITSSNPLTAIGCSGSTEWFKLKIRDAADFEKNAGTKSWAVNGVLTSHTTAQWPYLVKIKLATGDIEAWTKNAKGEAVERKLNSDYRINVDGVNHYNKLVVCAVPWRVGRFLLDTCYTRMRQELQDYADSEAVRTAAAPGLLRNKTTVELMVIC